MTHPEGAQVAEPTRATIDLATWDWRAELRAQERSVPWLAKRTDRAQQTVYNYGSGVYPTPIEWLRQAAIVLGVVTE